MARVTVEDCLEREENRFALVVLAATRTRQLMKGSDALVRTKNKPAVTSSATSPGDSPAAPPTMSGGAMTPPYMCHLALDLARDLIHRRGKEDRS